MHHEMHEHWEGEGGREGGMGGKGRKGVVKCRKTIRINRGRLVKFEVREKLTQRVQSPAFPSGPGSCPAEPHIAAPLPFSPPGHRPHHHPP